MGRLPDGQVLTQKATLALTSARQRSSVYEGKSHSRIFKHFLLFDLQKIWLIGLSETYG